jgi:hypothetical protein
MNELVSAFKKFIMRDISFIIGGSLVILSFLSIYERIYYLEYRNIVVYLLFVAVAYTIGYGIQDGLTFLGIIRTKAGSSPSWFGKKLYRWFEKYKDENDKKDVPYPNVEENYVEAKLWLYGYANKRFQADHERIESLKQVGTAIGPCFVIAALILIAEPLITKITFRWALISVMLIHGIILFALGWLKVTQQAQYLLKHWEIYKLNKKAEKKKKK